MSNDLTRSQYESLSQQLTLVQTELSDIRHQFNSAFAGNDVDGHRRYHEAAIIKLERQSKIMDAVIEKTLHGALWAIMILVGSALWSYVKKHIN